MLKQIQPCTGYLWHKAFVCFRNVLACTIKLPSEYLIANMVCLKDKRGKIINQA